MERVQSDNFFKTIRIQRKVKMDQNTYLLPEL